MKKFLSVILLFVFVLSMTTCARAETGLDIATASWEDILKAAKGTTVTFYGWGGDENRNNWLNTTVADYVKKNFDVTLEIIGMNIDDILAKLSGEKQAGSKTGPIDMIWINGENFYSARDNGLLWGPFTDKLPNMEKYIDLKDPETLNDFCKPIDGYEVPYAKAQMVMYNDRAVTPETPKNTDEFLDFCKKYQGRVTYPALPDFTGSAFVRNIIYELCGWEQFQTMKPDYDTVKAAIQPALNYLRQLNPYLWNEGKTFPDSSVAVNRMFMDGEIVMSMSYGPFAVAIGIEKGMYPDTAQTFVFDKGTIGNTNYMAIAFDSPNKAGSMVVINAIISATIQQTQYAQLRSLPVVAQEKLSPEEKAAFENVNLGQGVLTQSELLKHRLPEMPADLVPVIEQIWLDEVVGK